MRPGQNKRLRGRSGRKGPNPLTRSFESNGPDVKIRGTAQHVAEKYLQLARDAQSSGDIVLAENLLQHAEHYFRLISAAQQAQAMNGFGRQSFDAEPDEDEDDDFSGVPDRFAPLSERLPPPSYQQPPQQPFVSAPAPQPLFAPQPPQPQPFEERPAFGDQARSEPQPRHERQARPQRPPFRERPQERSIVDRGEQSGEGGEGGRQFGFNRNRDRDRPRFQQRREPMGEQPPVADAMSPAGLPAFITAPAPRASAAPTAPVEASEPIMAEDREASVFHNRRRRKLRPQLGEAGGPEEASLGGELPLGD